MSVNPASPLQTPVTVAVAPTETTVLTVTRDSLRAARRITVQIYNADAAQTFAGVVYRKVRNMTAYAVSTLPDFSSIGPLSSVMADLDVEGTDELQIRGTMSGAGGNVQVGATRKGDSP